MKTHTVSLWISLIPLLLVVSCTGSVEPTEFTNPRFDFGFVERVAVFPFENLSNDREAGFRVSRLIITELLASGAVDVVEPGEVAAKLIELHGGTYTTAIAPNTELIQSMGRELGVQAVIVGTVAQSQIIRSGAVGVPVVTLDAHMVEAETGSTVWAATHTEKGGALTAKVLGTGAAPISQTTRKCVRQLLASLIE